MKKAKFGVAVLLAFAIVLGFAFETKADSPLTFSGLLRLRGFVLEGFPPFSPLAGAEDVGDGYFVTRFRLNVVFKPTDFLEVRWRLHAPGAARWGAGNWSAATMYAYGVVKTTAGTVSAGRVSSDIDSAGFQTLGYNPGWGFNAQAYVFDVDSERDGVMYRNTWDNGFGLKAFYVKRASELPPTKDGDYDRFSIEPYYKWDGGGVSFAVQYDRDQTGGVERDYLISVNPSLVLSWATGENSSLSVNAEAKYSFGKYRATPGAVEQDQVGAGLYADLTYGYGTGNVSVAGWWFEGGSHDERSPAGAGAKLHGRVNGGEGFYPLMIYYYGNSFVQGSSDLAFGGFEQPNHWGIALLGNHKLTEKITLNYGLGHLRRSSDYTLLDGATVSNNLGTEVDLGLTVRLIDKLQYSTKVGYFFVGDFYSEFTGRDRFTDGIWGWANELIYSF